MANASINNAADLSGNSRESGQHQGSDPGGGGVWTVVKEALPKLRTSLDITELKTYLYSAGLINAVESHELRQSDKAKPDHTEDLLTQFIGRGNEGEFDRFLRVLDCVPTYCQTAAELKEKAEGIRRSQSKQTSGTEGGIAGPWQAVKDDLPKLKNCLNMTVLRSHLWSASLINYDLYCELGLSQKTEPESAEEVLTKFVESYNEQQFYRFLGVLESVPIYRHIAKGLKTKAGEARESDERGSQVCPFVIVRRSDGKLCDLAVDGTTIDKINGWEIYFQHPQGTTDNLKTLQRNTDDGNSSLSSSARKADQSLQDPDLCKSRKLLSKLIKLPVECKEKGNARVVVLAGEVTEIVAWLRENEVVTEEQELGKIIHSSMDNDAGVTGGVNDQSIDAIVTSGIFCVLPQDSNTLYVVVRLGWMDESEVQLRLLRIALELSPLWLVFYSRAGIEQNGLCAEAYREPDVQGGKYFLKKSLDIQKTTDVQKTTDGFVNQVRQAIRRFPYGNNFVQSLAVLHIEYVFNVSLSFFSSTMVYHNPLMEDSQAKCTVLTHEIFAVQSDTRTRNPDIAQIQQGLPDLTVGVSLRRELKPTSVEAYPVDLRWWLQMSSSYVEVAMLSCSTEAKSVCCTPFPKAQTTEHASKARMCEGVAMNLSEGPGLPPPSRSYQVDELSNMAASGFTTTADDQHSQEVSKEIRKAMETMTLTLPSSLTHTFLKWRGPVQAIVCVAADVQKACNFLNELTGSNLGLFAHNPTPRTFVEEASKTHHKQPGSLSIWYGERQDARASVTTSTSHSHFPVSRVWMCCRPSDAVLYVLMCFDRLSLAAAACPDGYQESVALVTAAALANMFVVLTEGFPQNTDILETLLLPGLRHFGMYFPARGDDREEQLFNSVLVPIVAHADLEHECTSGNGCTKCTKHFQRICKKKTWNTEITEQHLQHYFAGIQPTSSRRPGRTVAKLLSESHLFHKSGSHFQKMLQLVLAAVKVQGQGGIRQLKHLLIERIMEGEWNEFKRTLNSYLIHGEVKGKLLCPSSPKVSFMVDVDGKKVNVEFSSTLEFSLLEQKPSEAGVSCSKDQQYVRQLILQTTAAAWCQHLYPGQSIASYKGVPPPEMQAAFVSALHELVTRRAKDCTAWWKRAIEKEQFNTSDGARKKCVDLVSMLEEQWNVCREQCQGSSRNRCLYHCLLPANHGKNVPHNCLDPSGKHTCEHQCKFCEADAQPCTKPAGHQHTGSYDDRLHKCDKEHLCEETCSLSASRTCTAKLRHKGILRPGKCHYRVDHFTRDGHKAQDHLCTVSHNNHKCEKSCELEGTPGCKDGFCDSVSGHGDSKHHLCGEQHTCQEWCDQAGVCMHARSDEPQQQKHRMLMKEGKNGWRLRCHNQQIPPRKRKHDALCDCGRQHTCNKVCPFCKCYCKKVHKHKGLCDVEHGEICTKMEVFSNIRKEAVPVRDGALRCDQICLHAGRGHEHRVSHRRQQPECIPHDKFWQQHKLVDPYGNTDIDNFLRCPEACQHSDHSKNGLQQYCTEQLNHKQLPAGSLTSKFHGNGYISHKRNDVPDGHHFPCTTHMCKDSGGICKKTRNGGKNCDKPCSLKLGHTGGCTCGDKHECGLQCAAWKCKRTCTILSEIGHNAKDCSCQEGGCTQDCDLCDSPKKQCCSDIHLHKPTRYEKHFCSEKHPCKAMCEEEGICALSARDKTPEHAVFERKGINGLTLKCSVKQPVGRSVHPNRHSCERKHTCEKCCPLCGYYCERQLHHIGDCKTHHGPVLAKNLVNLQGKEIITADKKEMKIEGAVTCDQICHQAGRGHSHKLKCNCTASLSSTFGLSQKTSQPTRLHYTDANGGWDLASHSEFWKLLKPSFTDPAEDRREFELCGVLCSRCKQEGKRAECMEEIHHKPPDWEGYTGQGFVGPKAHTGTNGHRFSSDGHMCKKTCTNKVISGFSFPPWRACGKPCNGQEDHEKKCQCEKHWGLCGEPCNVAECKSTCDIKAAQEHRVHKCKETGCKIRKCEFSHCTNSCVRGHGHVLSEDEGQLSHHCGLPHSCKKSCNSKGVCFRDAKGQAIHQPCHVKIPVGMKNHVGDCTCGRSHGCLTLCPLCTQPCKYAVDHECLHDFHHGKVVSNGVKDFKGCIVEEKLYCHHYCKKASRGHTHPLPPNANPERGHEAVSPNGIDVTHSYFWAQHKIEDPLRHEDLPSMDGCPAVCPTCKAHYCNGTSPWHLDIPGHGVGSEKKVQASWLGTAVYHHYSCLCKPSQVVAASK